MNPSHPIRLSAYVQSPDCPLREGTLRKLIYAATHDPADPFRDCFMRVGDKIFMIPSAVIAWMRDADRRDREKYAARSAAKRRPHVGNRVRPGAHGTASDTAHDTDSDTAMASIAQLKGDEWRKAMTAHVMEIRARREAQDAQNM